MQYTVEISRSPFEKKFIKKFRSLEDAIIRCESFLEVSRYDLRTAFTIRIYKRYKPSKSATYFLNKQVLRVIVHANYSRYS